MASLIVTLSALFPMAPRSSEALQLEPRAAMLTVALQAAMQVDVSVVGRSTMG